MNQIGFISKMVIQPGRPAVYGLPLGDTVCELNPLVGQKVVLVFTGKIQCHHCHKLIKKTYQGYCYPCSQILAACDLCIVKPELCHYHLGTCREPSWGDSHCMVPTLVYLSLTSDLKVGITRKGHAITRWLDQGASMALPIIEASSRRVSGFIEEAFKPFVKDKTNWRTMLKGDSTSLDLGEEARRLIQLAEKGLEAVRRQFGSSAFKILEEMAPFEAHYPVQKYPEKVSSFSFDKHPRIEGVLEGLKGQYLLLDKGVFNIRSHTGYEMELKN